MTIVTLTTGEAVDSASEAWRHECEARMVAKMPNTQARHEYVAAVERKRGAEAAGALRDLATKIRMIAIAEADAMRAQQVTRGAA